MSDAMCTITVRIFVDNPTFAEDASVEVARILSELSSRVMTWDGNVANWTDDIIPLRDSTGRRVGDLRVYETTCVTNNEGESK